MNEPRTRARIGLLLPQDMRDRLEAAAAINERTVSQEARVALREHLGGRDLTDRARVFGDTEVRG